MKKNLSALLNLIFLAFVFLGCQSPTIPDPNSSFTYVSAGEWGSESSARLAKFIDCTVDDSGNVYCIDPYAGKLIKFDSSGTVIFIWENLISPARLTIDSENNLFLVENSSIMKYDQTKNLLLKIDAGSFEDVSVDAEGNIYGASSIGEHLVKKFDSQGTFIGSWGAGGTEEEWTFKNGPVGIEVKNNYIYVVDHYSPGVDGLYYGGTLYVYDLDGRKITSNTTGLPANGGICVDSADRIYATASFDSQTSILRYNGSVIDELYRLERQPSWGINGSGELEFKVPTGIAVDTDSSVYIADLNNARIQKISPGKNYLTQFTYSYQQADLGGFDDPQGIEIDGDGNLFIADRGNKRIVEYDQNGNIQLSLFQNKPRVYDPIDIDIGSGNVLFVLDGNRLVKISPDGEELGSWRSWSVPGDNFSILEPTALALDSDENIYITNTEYSQILVIDKLGNFVDHIEMGGDMGRPLGIVVDQNRRIYCTTDTNKVYVMSQAGKIIDSWGAGGTKNGQLNTPMGIDIDSLGRVVVLDTGNNRVQIFDPNGQFLRAFGSFGSGKGQFDTPEGIAVTTDNAIFVTEKSNHRVQKFVQAGG